MVSLKNITFIKMQTLLLCLVVLLIASPAVEEIEGDTAYWLSILSALVIVASVLNACDYLWQALLGFFLAAFWLLLTFGHIEAHPAVAPFVGALLMGFTIAVILQKIFHAKQANSDILYSALSVYLLLGVVWSSLYTVIYHLNPAAFALPHVNPDYVSVHFLYFSFVTLTTLGYGDILPISPPARMLAAAEAVTGVVYLAVIIARLVNLYRKDK